MQIRVKSKIPLILFLVCFTMIYPFLTTLVSKNIINENPQKIQNFELNSFTFNQTSLFEWNNLIRSVDKDKNGINDQFEKNLELIAENGFISYSNYEKRSKKEFLEESIIQSKEEDIIIKKESIPIVISFPEGNYDSIKELFEKLGGIIKSSYKKAINGFAGSIDYDTLIEFRNELNSNEIPYIIEEDALYKAQLYYTTRNMNLRPYVWNNLSYDGDFYSSIAVLDTGIDDSHDFFGLGYSEGDPNYKIIGWHDIINNESLPYDDNSHGTHCSGIATGIGSPNYDYLGRSVSTASYELNYGNTYITSPGTYEVNWARFNVTNPGIIEIPIEFEDTTPSPDDVNFYGYLYFEDTLVASYINDSDTWMHNLSYTVPSTDLGLYSFRFDLNLVDGNDGYLYDWNIKFRSEIHWPFSPNLYGSGDPWIGIAPDAHLVGVKVLDQYGSGYLSDIVDGINWVITNKNNYNITTISMSLGGPSGQTSMISAVNNAVENGIVTVVSAGNDYAGSNNIGSPGDADNVITVASMNVDDQVTSYSSQGGNSYTGNTIKPDVTAPGGSHDNLQMFSADTNDNDAEGAYPTEGYFDDLYGAQGTSMAAPAVAGAVNLLIEAMGGKQSWGFTGTEAKRVKALILMSATETYPLQRESPYSIYSPTLNRGGKDVHEGYGRINVDVAIEAYTQQLFQGSQKISQIYSSVQDPFKKHGLGCYVDLISGSNYIFTLEVPNGADFDLHLYSNEPSSIGEPIMLASSISDGLGMDEIISFTAPETGKYYLIAKAISGEGNATINYPILEHDIGVSLEVPSHPELYNSYFINATIFNNGENDESNVNLTLYLDDVIVDSKNIPNFQAGDNDTISYQWEPLEYRTYNFTAYSPTISGEIITSNNIESQLITVSSLRNYTMTTDFTYSWIDVSSGSELLLDDDDYSLEILPFNFTFYNESFSTVYVGSNGYLSFTSPPTDWINVPIPSADPDHTYLIAPFWDDLCPSYGGGGGNIYVQSFGSYWVAEWFNIEHYSEILVGSFEVILYESGEIVFNYDYLDYTSGEYTCGLNLGLDTRYFNYYQGLTDSTNDFSILFSLESMEHDLRVSLDTPKDPELDSSYIITATVRNNGGNDESDIFFYLYYDEVLINDTFISTLPIGASKILTYNWTPTVYRTYNFTAYAPPVINETFISNNLAEKLITIHEVELFNGLFIDHSITQTGYGSGTSRVSYSHITGSMFHVDWETTIGGTPSQGSWIVNAQTRVIQNTNGSGFGNNVHTPFWIFTNASSGDIIPIAIDGEGDHNFNITGDFLYDLSGFGLVDVWELEDLTVSGGSAWYEKSTGILLYGNFYMYGGLANYFIDFVNTNATFDYIVFDHDLKVSLETPISIKIDNSYTINATVKNVGLNDESNVELLLYLDEIHIGTITIPYLAVGMSQTIQYIWTPNEYRGYNFTAYAPPTAGESYVDNNRKTTIAYVIDTKLFEGLYIKHIYSEGGYNFNTNFTYTHYTSRLFYETWNIEFMGVFLQLSYLVDALTRELSGGSAFGDGNHTIGWIFTNVSLYDTIPITVDAEGDHNFYVAQELVYDLPGFGPVEVWELEDLTQPGGIAWYEKSTGILLNGTFYYSGGNYTFDFVDTNADLYILGENPGNFVLSSNAGDPDPDGNFDLTWTVSSGATNYSVYRYSSYITEINGSLTLLADEITDLSMALSSYTDGIYYFIAVAHNNFGDTLSNCISVSVEIPLLPGDFVLSSNAGDPDSDGNFDLTWTVSSGAINYSIYRYSSFITEINGSLTLLADEITDLSMGLSGYTDGTYYFIAVAHNDYGDTLSNCINVSVEVPQQPPGDFVLSSNAGDPDPDGNFDLTWTVSSGATNYSIYRYSSYITEINGSLTLLADEIIDLSMGLTSYSDGTYYFIVVAHNDYGDTLSNCVEITVLQEGIPPGIPGFSLMVILSILGISILFVINKNYKKTNKN